jgi:uncharacterized membrane protein YecN with MAPEG domain
MTMPFPYFTAATAVVLAVLQMLLLLYTALGRGKYKVGLGDGQNPALLKRMRMHGNLAENLPLFLIMLGLVEISGQWAMFVPWIAIGFIVVRLSHIVGLVIGDGANPFRFIGGAGTIAVILILARLLVGTLMRDTHWLAALPHG